MEENKNNMDKLDEEISRHREMTEKRKNKRKKILKYVAIGVVVAAGAGAGLVGCNYIMVLLNDAAANPMPPPMIMGGAMGQWEEVPMQRIEELSLRGNTD